MNSILKCFLLIATAAITMATSARKDGSPTDPNKSSLMTTRTYLAASSCIGSTAEERIEVTDYMITSPPQLDFTHFGLPTQFLDVGEDLQATGQVNGRTRDCHHSRLKDGENPVDVYSCYEFGDLVCRISFERAG